MSIIKEQKHNQNQSSLEMHHAFKFYGVLLRAIWMRLAYTTPSGSRPMSGVSPSHTSFESMATAEV